MTIIFKNKSALPLECISTFGVSAKETDSPIGYFGTGLKYAIAVLLREGCEIKIYIDDVEYEFKLVKQEVRGKEFDFIYMNDQQLPFTSELGKNWSLWQAYRELYSNCMDEKGEVFTRYTDESDPTHGTTIVVQGLDEIHLQATNTFILQSTPKYVLNNVEVHESKTPAIFYKGIKVLELPTKYSYNILDDLTLTEDRTVSQYDAEYEITLALIRTENLDCLMDILSITDESYHEAKFNWNRYSEPSETFMRLVSKLKEKPHALSTYYGHHEAKFMGKLDRAHLSVSIQKKLTRLRNSLSFKPAEIFVSALDRDYVIIPEGLVLNIELLANPRKLNFIYEVACHKMRTKKPNADDFKIVLEHMLGSFVTRDTRRKVNSVSYKKAAQ